MSDSAKRRSIRIPTAEEDRRINAAARSDPDAQPLTAAQLGAMSPIQALRGRPRSLHPKRLVSIRYSAEVIDYFRSTGDGWQSRMNQVLERYVKRTTRKADR